MTDFEAQVLADLSVLKNQMKGLVGNGQPRPHQAGGPHEQSRKDCAAHERHGRCARRAAHLRSLRHRPAYRSALILAGVAGAFPTCNTGGYK